jgi:hypothetical protein
VHFGHRRDAVEHRLNALRELHTQAGAQLLVSVERFIEVMARLATIGTIEARN